MFRALGKLVLVGCVIVGGFLAYDELIRPATHLETAHDLMDTGNHADAIHWLYLALRDDPTNSWIMVDLAECHDKNGEPHKAASCYAAAEQLLNDPSESVRLSRHRQRWAVLRGSGY